MTTKKEPKIKIFVVHHKPWYIYGDDIYTPIQVWKKNAKVDLWILWDDTWDNISDRNGEYAELTAQYWVWKNYDLSDVDYVWFCHYRRYFSYWYRTNPFHMLRVILTKIPWLYNKCLYTTMYALWSTKMVNWDEWLIKKFSNIKLSEYIEQNNSGIYTFKPIFTKKTFYHFHLSNDKIRSILENIIVKRYPEYIKTEKLMEKSRRFCGCNMFIMKTKLFYEYSEWLFAILEDFEKLVIKYDLKKDFLLEEFVAGSRYIWCLSERLFNLRFVHQSMTWKRVSTTLWTFHFLESFQN